MPKLKISQKQYNTIILREQESRLNASRAILNENLTESTQLLEEGWREVVLGVAMMLGIGLTGQNKVIAQDAVKNATTMSQIKSTLEDEGKIGELVDALKAKGMKDPETMLSTNAEKVVDAYNRIAGDDDIKYKVDVKVVNNLQALKGKLGQGYSLKNADISTDTINHVVPEPISIQDTLDVNFGSDNMFVTGGYTLSPAGVDAIKLSINEIIKQGGKILNVEIESSTDSERIPKFMDENDPTGNIKLATLRTKSVADMIASIATGVDITHREIPNNGSHIVSTKDFIKANKDPNTLVTLRDKSREFRYIKIKVVVVFESSDTTTTQEKLPEFIKNYRFELVKVIESSGKTRKITTKSTFKNKKWKCQKSKGSNKGVKCATF